MPDVALEPFDELDADVSEFAPDEVKVVFALELVDELVSDVLDETRVAEEEVTAAGADVCVELCDIVEVEVAGKPMQEHTEVIWEGKSLLVQ